MMWVDYNIDQAGQNFRVSGDWPGEVMGVAKDGTPKDNYLYKSGDVFVVNENGWLVKSDRLLPDILRAFETGQPVIVRKREK